jgi:hypothetical protein
VVPSTEVVIPARFNGPPNSANGGYACGVVAAAAEGQVAVSLRVPPPLDAPMEFRRGEDGVLHLVHGTTVVAEAMADEPVAPTVPRQVTHDEAVEASRGYVGFERHPFPTCWVCGPERDDGLRVFTGPVDGAPDGLVASSWTPARELDAGDGSVDARHVWAALDCPTYFGAVNGREAAVLARLTATIHHPVEVGRPCVVVGWGAEEGMGRKRFGAAAVVGVDGRVLASSRALWITLSPEAMALHTGEA